MDKFTKRLFSDLRRLEARVEQLERLVSGEPSGSTLKSGPVGLSEINHSGEAWAGTNAAQAQDSPECCPG